MIFKPPLRGFGGSPLPGGLGCEQKFNYLYYICTAMNKNEINNLLINYFRPYKPVKIGIFGSFARDEQTKDSDIDILIKFQNTISLLELARIKRELSQILGREIDIITENSLKNENLKKYIYKDLKIIFE